ncbi:ATP-grasp domain-containing protein [Candidatus Nanosalina sp. VS9-1]|uniref:ATP-grasp domain-containing protein n=1 Tax=Candidatus Nanosalina sp. VS9-1 TaxID=3388566 RepID=UPI0039DF2C93
MKCAVIYGKKSAQHHHFIEAGKKHFDKVLGAPLEGIRTVYTEEGTKLMYNNTDLCEFDAVYLRLLGNDLMYGEHIPEVLRDNEVYTQLESDSLAIASNKFHMMKVLADGGLPVPRSTYTLSTRETERAGDMLGYPAVIKIISGYGGKGVMKADSRSDIGPITDTLTLFEQDICLQEFIDNPGEDIRVLVVGDETYAYKRVGGEEEFRSNISAGGAREKIEPSEEMIEASIGAAELCGLDIAGIDIIEDESEEGGFYIGEINASPGVEGTGEVIDADLADEFMAFIKRKTLEEDQL